MKHALPFILLDGKWPTDSKSGLKLVGLSLTLFLQGCFVSFYGTIGERYDAPPHETQQIPPELQKICGEDPPAELPKPNARRNPPVGHGVLSPLNCLQSGRGRNHLQAP